MFRGLSVGRCDVTSDWCQFKLGRTCRQYNRLNWHQSDVTSHLSAAIVTAATRHRLRLSYSVCLPISVSADTESCRVQDIRHTIKNVLSKPTCNVMHSRLHRTIYLCSLIFLSLVSGSHLTEQQSPAIADNTARYFCRRCAISIRCKWDVKMINLLNVDR